MIKNKFKVGIVGLGYVGLPFLHLLTKKKINVYGFDIDKEKISNIKKNKSYISDLKDSEIKIINKNKIFSMSEIHNIKKMDYIIFCLPTPLNTKLAPDITIIKKAFKKIKKFLKKNQTLILESTVYPGATKHIFHNFLSKNFDLEKNFFYGYSSERISPGQINKKEYKFFLHNTTKVISGYNKKSLYKIHQLYKKVFQKTYKAQTIEIAEMSKLVENSYRSVNIGLVNEIKRICYKLKINFNQVLDASATKPFGFNLFRPGPGVGGHCIPIDPIFITWIAKKYNEKANFIELARNVNLNITNWILNKICTINKNIKHKKTVLNILIVGLAYKADVNDLRESPAIKIFKYLSKFNNNIFYHDPFVKDINVNNSYFKSCNLNLNKKYDLTVICTDHSNLPKSRILKISKQIFDTRGLYKNNISNKIIQL